MSEQTIRAAAVRVVLLAAVGLVACNSSAPQPRDATLSRPSSGASVGQLGDLRPEPVEERDLPAIQRARAAVCGATPVDSNLASVFRGGGCFPPGIRTTGTDQLILIDPEWAPVVERRAVDSAPVLVHGTVVDFHGDRGGDFPTTHFRNDTNTFVELDCADRGRLGTGNSDGIFDLEWETGALPDWAWASPGDRVVALGRWIFDCGHPDPVPGACSSTGAFCLLDSDCGAGASCAGARFNYRTEMHPPHAAAVLRPPRGAALRRDDEDEAQLVTRADVFASAFGGAAGERCTLTHQNSIEELFATDCFKSPQMVAQLNGQDFSFELPLPPRPRGRATPIWRVERRPTPALPGQTPVEAELSIQPAPDGGTTRLLVTVHLSRAVSGALPTGFAASISAGWREREEAELRHLRVFVDGVLVNLPLKPDLQHTIRDVPGWRMQVAVNGRWQQLSGLQGVDGDSAGSFFAPDRPVVADLFVGRGDTLRIQADGASSNCVDSMFGQSLGTNLFLFGFNFAAAIGCLNSVAANPGTVSVSFTGPRFGARRAAYETLSQGGDAPGAFALRYRIARAGEDD